MKNITFIVPVYNCSDTIERCLESIKDYNMVIVYKESKDDTLKKIGRFKPNKQMIFLHQKKSGLADARNIGLRAVDTEYCVMWGSDNYLKGLFKLHVAISCLKFNDWIGCGLRTEIFNPKGYFDNMMNVWWDRKITEGQREVVGTPVVYKTDILKKFKYSVKNTHSDDTDLGHRLAEKGYKQGYCGAKVYEIINYDFASIYEKFLRYGKSDSEYWRDHHKEMSFKRKIRSLLHPIISNWIGFKLTYIPFFCMIILIRYWGYLRGNKKL